MIQPIKITRLLILCLLFILIVMSFLAIAQVIPEEARRHMARGQAAVEMAKSNKDFEVAIWEFQKAAELVPSWPKPHYYIGLSQEKAGNFREAIASFKRYLQLAPNASDAAKIQEQIYKLEFKAEQVLTIPEIIDILCSFSTWKKVGEGDYNAILISRGESNFIKVTRLGMPYPEKYIFQTLNVEGPIIKFTSMIDNCKHGGPKDFPHGCPSSYDNEIEVISRNKVTVKQTVRQCEYLYDNIRGYNCYGSLTRNYSCEYIKN